MAFLGFIKDFPRCSPAFKLRLLRALPGGWRHTAGGGLEGERPERTDILRRSLHGRAGAVTRFHRRLRWFSPLISPEIPSDSAESCFCLFHVVSLFLPFAFFSHFFHHFFIFSLFLIFSPPFCVCLCLSSFFLFYLPFVPFFIPSLLFIVFLFFLLFLLLLVLCLLLWKPWPTLEEWCYVLSKTRSGKTCHTMQHNECQPNRENWMNFGYVASI